MPRVLVRSPCFNGCFFNILSFMPLTKSSSESTEGGITPALSSVSGAAWTQRAGALRIARRRAGHIASCETICRPARPHRCSSRASGCCRAITCSCTCPRMNDLTLPSEGPTHCHASAAPGRLVRPEQQGRDHLDERVAGEHVAADQRKEGGHAESLVHDSAARRRVSCPRDEGRSGAAGRSHIAVQRPGRRGAPTRRIGLPGAISVGMSRRMYRPRDRF